MRYSRLVRLALALGCVAPIMAAADGPRVSPGQWEFTTTASGQFLPQPRRETETRCIKDENVDPVKEMTKTSHCTVGEQSVSGKTVTWTMTCRAEASGPSMTGTGRITADGTTLEGDMTNSIEMNGQSQAFMKMTWTGRRLGDCP
jgi:Protein of unknown function (DUF3617)